MKAVTSGALYLYTQPFFIKNKNITSAQSQSVYWDILTKVAAHSPSSCLVILPSSQLKKWLFNKIGSVLTEAALLPEILTIDELVLRNTDQQICDTKIYDSLLFNEIVTNSIYKDDWFKDIQNLPGFKNQFLDLVNDIQKYSININHLKNTSDFGVTAKMINFYINKKLNSPIHDLLTTYHKKRKHSFSYIKKYIKEKTLFFLGFWDPPPYQKYLLKTLITQSATTSFLIDFSPNSEMYSAATSLYTWLKQLPVTIKEIPLKRRSNPLPTLDQEKEKTLCPIFSLLQPFKFNSVEEELSFIAKEIIDLLKKDPSLKLSDIVIVVPCQKYREEMEMVLQAHNLLRSTNSIKKLCNNPLSIFLSRFLSLVDSAGDRDLIVNLLKAPLVKSVKDSDLDKVLIIKADFIESILTKIGYKDDFDSCLVGWQSYRQELLMILKETKRDSLLNKQVEKQLLLICEQYHVLTNLFNLIRKVKQASSIYAFIDELKMLFELFSISDQIQDIKKIHTSTISSEVLHQETLGAYLSLIQFLDEFAYSKNIVSPYFDVSETITLLKNALEEQNFSFNNSLIPGIELLGKFEAFRICKKIFFVAGFIENYWPGVIKENIFLPEKLRNKLGLPNQKTYYDWDKYLFFSFLSQAEKAIYLSYPEFHESAPTLPSHFIALLEQFLNTSIIFKQAHKHPYLTNEEYLLNSPDILGGLKNSLNFEANNFTLGCFKNQSLHQNLDKNSLCGYFTNKEALKRLTTILKNAPFSVTQLETYQKCPYQYLYKYLIKEEAVEEVTEDISAKTWGLIMHKILQNFAVVFYNNGYSFHNLKFKTKAKEILSQVAKEVLKKHAKDSFYWTIKKLFLFGDKENIGMLDVFLETEFSSPLSIIPSSFEYHFCEKIFITPHKFIALEGLIDVVLESKTEPFFAVMDYKTGSKLVSSADIKNYRNLQLPIYQMVLKQIYPSKECVGSIVYQVKDSRNIEKRVVCTTEQGKELIFDLQGKKPYIIGDVFYQDLKNHLSKLEYLIYQGIFCYIDIEELKFMEKEKKSNCQFCSYIFICKYNRRWQT